MDFPDQILKTSYSDLPQAKYFYSSEVRQPSSATIQGLLRRLWGSRVLVVSGLVYSTTKFDNSLEKALNFLIFFQYFVHSVSLI